MIKSTDAREYENLKFHPAAEIFPLLTEDDFDAFAEDVRVKGILEPIKLFEGMVIDGRNRYRAYVITKSPPNFQDVDALVKEVGGPAEYVLSLGDKRRHLDKSQLAMCAVRYKEVKAAEAKERQKEHGGTAPGKKKNTCGNTSTSDREPPARDKAGEKFGISGKTVDMAEKVKKKGAAEVVAAVDAGKVSVSAAAKIVELPKEEQAEAVKKAVSRKKPAKKAGGVKYIESHWEKAFRFIDRVESVFSRASVLLVKTDEYRETRDAIANLRECFKSLQRKAKN